MIKVFELFAGIGAPLSALKRCSIEFESLGFSEIDKSAIEQYNALHGESINFGDIRTIESLPEGIDLLIHGSPCQSFSTAGKLDGAEKGSGSKSSLIWESVRLINSSKPKIVLWENVDSVLNKRNVKYFNEYIEFMESIGYKSTYRVLNSIDFGIPQNRKRIFVISFLDHNQFKSLDEIKMNDTLPDIDQFVDFNSIPEIPPTNAMSAKRDFDRSKFHKSIYRNNGGKFSIAENKDFCNTLICSNPTVKKLGNRWDYLTPRERYLLSGFTESDYDKVKHFTKTTIQKTTGNTIVVNVLMAIFDMIYKS